MITFRWFSCHGQGTATCAKENFEENKVFYKKVFGAYRFEIV